MAFQPRHEVGEFRGTPSPLEGSSNAHAIASNQHGFVEPKAGNGLAAQDSGRG